MLISISKSAMILFNRGMIFSFLLEHQNFYFMATLINLNDLLRHEILDLYSAEEQIIEALPRMIEKATNGNLKKALNDHLRVTEQQKKRLDQVKELLGENQEIVGTEENKGFFFAVV